MDPVLFAFLVTLAAGLCTGIGSAIAFFTGHTNRAFLSVALGFSAGVMIYVSFVEILPKATDALFEQNGSQLRSIVIATIGFFAGMLMIAIIDKLIPRFANPHEGLSVELMENPAEREEIERRINLRRTGVFVALAVGDRKSVV